MILNLQTGLVSPQYYCQYDDLFETTMGTQARSRPTSQWQFKADFTSDKPDINEEDEPPERYGMIKALKNITHHRKVKRHPHLQT